MGNIHVDGGLCFLRNALASIMKEAKARVHI